MPTRYTPADPVTAARLAEHTEQIRTLQRERREDRDEARESMDDMRAEIRHEITSLRQALTDGLAGVRAELVPIRGEIAPITDMRKRGVAFLLGACLAGMALGYKFLEPLLKWLGLK